MTRALLPLGALAAMLALSGCGGTSTTTGTPHAGAQRTSRSAAPPSTPGKPPATAFTPHRASARTVSWHLPVPTARQAVAASSADHLVLAGGMVAGDSSTDQVWSISLPGGRARRLPALAVPVHDAAGGSYAGAPAVFGGGNATEQSLVQALHGSAWSRVDTLPTTRSDLSVVEAGRRTLVLGGYDGSAVPRSVLAQQGSGRLRVVGRLAHGVRYAAATVLGGSAYVLGGEVAGHELDTVQRVDLRTGRTRVVAHLPVATGHAMAVTEGDRILLMGGRTSSTASTARMWWYDPASARFSRAGSLPRPLSDAAVVRRGRDCYLLGGEDPGVTDRVVRVSVS